MVTKLAADRRSRPRDRETQERRCCQWRDGGIPKTGQARMEPESLKPRRNGADLIAPNTGKRPKLSADEIGTRAVRRFTHSRLGIGTFIGGLKSWRERRLKRLGIAARHTQHFQRFKTSHANDHHIRYQNFPGKINLGRNTNFIPVNLFLRQSNIWARPTRDHFYKNHRSQRWCRQDRPSLAHTWLDARLVDTRIRFPSPAPSLRKSDLRENEAENSQSSNTATVFRGCSRMSADVVSFASSS